VLFSSRIRVRFSVWLVSCYTDAFVRLQVVAVMDRGSPVIYFVYIFCAFIKAICLYVSLWPSMYL